MTAGRRVVMFRHAPIDIDSRAKKFATTLARGGYEPIVISLEPAGGRSGEFLLGGHIRVIRVPIAPAPGAEDGERHSNLEARRALHRRRRVYRERMDGPTPAAAKALAKWVLATARVVVLKGRETAGDALFRLRQERDRRSHLKDPFVVAGVDRNLPVVRDISHTLTDLLVSLEPDVLHAHHPQVLLAARDALQQLREQGRPAHLFYDARENFAGIPPLEQGLKAAHETLVACERAMIDRADAVSTVSEPIADVLQEAYRLSGRPAVFLNMPPLGARQGSVTVREAAGLAEGVPLVVYSGTMSWARGIETMIRSLAFLPAEVHLVIVSVPLPHPMVPKLEELAAENGVSERLHFVGPVGQNELLHYLSGADVAVHPLPGGSPNHDAAMPNKLFEYLHAGLPLVVSDAKLMAEFVRETGTGRVFESENPRSCAQAIAAVLDNPPEQTVAELAERYSWQAQESRILDLYDRVTGHRSPRPDLDQAFGSLEVIEPS